MTRNMWDHVNKAPVTSHTKVRLRVDTMMDFGFGNPTYVVDVSFVSLGSSFKTTGAATRMISVVVVEGQSMQTTSSFRCERCVTRQFSWMEILISFLRREVRDTKIPFFYAYG